MIWIENSSLTWIFLRIAAVNFGQYDNAAYMPYKPSKIRKKIPEIDSHEEGVSLLSKIFSALVSDINCLTQKNSTSMLFGNKSSFPCITHKSLTFVLEIGLVQYHTYPAKIFFSLLS